MPAPGRDDLQRSGMRPVWVRLFAAPTPLARTMTMSNTATKQSVAILLLMAFCGGDVAGQTTPELHVYLIDCAGLADRLLEAMRAEVDDIYADAGVRIVWFEARPPAPAQNHVARVYVLQELPLSLRRRMKISKRSAPMAITLGPTATQPSANIYVSSKAVLARASFRRAIMPIQEARALGRTLAHELAHRFLRSGHTKQGILRAVYSERDLIDRDRSDMFFTKEQIRLLKSTAVTN